MTNSYKINNKIFLILFYILILSCSLFSYVKIYNCLDMYTINNQSNLNKLTKKKSSLRKLIEFPQGVNSSDIRGIRLELDQNNNLDFKIRLEQLNGQVISSVSFNSNSNSNSKINILFPANYKLNSSAIYLTIISQNIKKGNEITFWLDKVKDINYGVLVKDNLSIKRNLFIITSLFLILASISLIYNVPLNYFFVLISIFIGGIFIFANPIGAAADEASHYSRTFSILNGVYLNQSYTLSHIPMAAQIPSAVEPGSGARLLLDINYKKSMNKLISKQEESGNSAFANSALYSPINYLPQAIGMFISKHIINYSKIYLAYGGRIFNLFLFIGLGFFSLKIIPIAKEYLLILLLLPMTLYQASSLSADTINIGLSILFFAYVIRFIHFDRVMTLYDVFFFALISLALGLCKQTLICIVFSFILIPQNRFKSRIFHFCSAICVLAPGFIGYLVWMILLNKNNLITDYINFFKINALSPKVAVMHILHNPLSFLSMILNSIIVYGKFYYNSMLGNFGYVRIRLDYFYYGLISLSLLFGLLMVNCHNITLRIRFLSLLIFVLFIFMTMLSLYLAWTPIGSKTIEGVQGRYFIPILPIITLLLGANSNIIKRYHAEIVQFIKISIMLSLNNSIVNLVIYYYCI